MMLAHSTRDQQLESSQARRVDSTMSSRMSITRSHFAPLSHAWTIATLHLGDAECALSAQAFSKSMALQAYTVTYTSS